MLDLEAKKQEILDKWSHATITDDFMFNVVMRDAAICKRFLEIVLGIEIDHIEYPQTQKVIDLRIDAKSIRLDVYVMDDEHTVYNIEMQTANKGSLPKRTRYYHGLTDMDLVIKGQSYSDLNKSFVIFVCTFDPFGKNLKKYTFKSQCQEDSSLLLDDGQTTVFLNSTGVVGEVSDDLNDLLKFVDHEEISENTFVMELDKAVTKARSNDEWRGGYMTLHMRDMENYNSGRTDGLAEGRTEGRAEGILLSLCGLIKKGVITVDDGAAEANMTVDEFLSKMEELGFSLNP